MRSNHEEKEDKNNENYIWSDFVCPFCFIGQANLDNALKTFEHKDEVEIEYKSFQLMPDAEYTPGETYAETFAKMKGIPEERAKGMFGQVTETAEQAGVEINYETAKLTNTLDAHRVFQYAKEQGKGTEFFKALYDAHFTNGEVLNDEDTLARLSESIGLNGDTVREIANSDQYNQDV
ncbi:DsbA family oxidoreductase [Jeotgalicoccus sp. WY2]|uniref:DsbA family oxidoreductase n=1 Tax=Jeotgalicoccus sp. WY2 TaxID=2708346 RepID=UPI0021136157|nr:DsbA family oxidoreductase [Jeotgalicoccus sp. WY2]